MSEGTERLVTVVQVSLLLVYKCCTVLYRSGKVVLPLQKECTPRTTIHKGVSVLLYHVTMNRGGTMCCPVLLTLFKFDTTALLGSPTEVESIIIPCSVVIIVEEVMRTCKQTT